MIAGACLKEYIILRDGEDFIIRFRNGNEMRTTEFWARHKIEVDLENYRAEAA